MHISAMFVQVEVDTGERGRRGGEEARGEGGEVEPGAEVGPGVNVARLAEHIYLRVKASVGVNLYERERRREWAYPESESR